MSMCSYLQESSRAAYTFYVHFPTFAYERRLGREGHIVIGVDEVGCGCLAGPVIAAAVHLPVNSRIASIHDSKELSAKERSRVFLELLIQKVPFALGSASVKEINEINIRQASLLAMRRAIAGLPFATFALVDAWTVPQLHIQQLAIIKGDQISKSIAAASIVAKVVRDRLMDEYDKDFPGFGLAVHKGYATAIHRQALRKFGPTSIHRPLFLRKLFENKSI